MTTALMILLGIQVTIATLVFTFMIKYNKNKGYQHCGRACYMGY